MFSGAASAMRDLARRLSPALPLQDALVAFQVLATFFLLSLPLETYADFIRFRTAGFASMSYRQWLGETTLHWLIDSTFYILGIVAVYGLIRRRPASWSLWATGVYGILAAAFVLIEPQYIDPLFNRITPMPEGPKKERILELARANGVPAGNVYVQDASRQSALLNAHVVGFGATAQIVLDDNTVAGTPDREVALVMAHEIGHYVLWHVQTGIVFDTLVIGIGFLMVASGLHRLLVWRGAHWGVGTTDDIGGLPLFWGLFLLWGFLSLPVSNTIAREQEREADLYGLNASQEPLGLAEFMIRDADAGELDPSPLEEALFFSHPSPRKRILAAMRWRAEHLTH